MDGLDIAIAGCGIAGLAAALLLHRQGHRITIYERFDEPQPLGSGLMLQPTGLAVLDRIGLADQVLRHGAPVNRLLGHNQVGEVVLDARYADLGGDAAFGIGIHRASLFAALHEAVCAAGIPIRTGHAVKGTECGARGRRLLFDRCDPSPQHDLVVDALGVATPLAEPTGDWLPFGALWTSLPWPDRGPFRPDHLAQRYVAARRMIGVLPVGRRPDASAPELALFWSIRADALERWRALGMTAWKDEVHDIWPECDCLLDQIHSPDQLTFARYAHRTLRHPLSERLIHIGDAWHSASPQLGQGANMALLDAWALACGLASDGALADRLGRAVALRRMHMRLYQWLTAFFTPLYQSDAIWPALLRDIFFAPLSRIGPGPRVQALLVGGLAGSPLERLGLTMPDYGALLRETEPVTSMTPLG